MARRHYASAIISTPSIKFEEWMDTIRNQYTDGAVPKDHINRIAKTILRSCDPEKYLLSHATIVASVDCFAPKGVKTGRLINRGVQIDVRWPDFRIKPECHEIINNNGDAWERSLLLSTYRTFIGAHNYLEHIQLPELSKGFLADAIARDLGKTCYIDILVATDRKHQQLIADILSGEITGLSMGCISLFTTCTKCGNVAADDAQLCPCVMYDGKGSKFIDESGVEQIVAELIGNVSVPNSNQFIEASWVRNPAFRGAVRRNILNADINQIASKLNESALIYELRKLEQPLNGISKAASIGRKAQGQDQELDSPESDVSKDDLDLSVPDDINDIDDIDVKVDSDTPKTSKNSIDELVEKAQEQLLQTIVDGLAEKLAPKSEDVGTVNSVPSSISINDNFGHASTFNKLLRNKFPQNAKLVKWASSIWKIVHVGGASAIKNAGLKPADLIVLSWIEDRVNNRECPSFLYKVAIQVGPLNKFPSQTSYLAYCKIRSGHSFTELEKRVLVRKGQIASLANY